MNTPLDKSQLREKYMLRRKLLAPEEHAEWSRRCCERLYKTIHDIVFKPAVIAGYAPIKDELDIMLALTLLAKDRHVTTLPVMDKEAGKRQMAFHPWQPGEKLIKKTYGIYEPEGHKAAVIPDIVIVPLLAFDRRGHRLGYGGGYYDAVLRKLRAVKPEALTIGVGFGLQETEMLPSETYDEILGKIVTEKELISI